MYGIHEFFKKIQNSFSKEILVRQAIGQAIKKHIGEDVPVENISIKNGVVQLKNVSQSAKSSIFIKKQAILREIATIQSLKAINDIR
jgi:hypothetical protein